MLVAGTIAGTLVGGSSTIGTAQLAYTYGLSAWWFTIGAGLGCLILGLVFVKPLRNSGCNTIQQVISSEYGAASGIITSVLASFGIMLNIVAQILSANALMTSMFKIGNVESAVISVVIMSCYVRINYPLIESSQAFPLFIINHMPPALGGVILATLLIALVGTGSGMALGFGTIINNDIYKIYFNKNASGKEELIVTRLVIFISLIISALLTLGNVKSAILTWGFMSMGLRAAVLIVPMTGALFFKGKIDKLISILSSILGFVSFLACEFFFS